MSLYVPRLPIQLDPLIAEAKRRARRRRLTVVAAVALVALGVGALGRWQLTAVNASAATAGSGKQCTANNFYGSACVDVRGRERQLTHVQAWMTLPSNGYLGGLKWRMDLERYLCDPIGTTKSTCSAATTWHGRTRNGAWRRPLTPNLVQSRSHRYWPTFALPHAFRTNVWLCTELAIRNPTRGWVYNAAGLPQGLRACVSVHG
jgi:hypothetical protein